MASDILPYEIKRMIFNYLNLPTTKSLRLVSQQWAAVGTEFLFPPSFHVRSFTRDILRLIDISQNPKVAHQFAKSTKELTFQITDWNPGKLRQKLVYRYTDPNYLESTGYVPTVEEQGAFDELHAVMVEDEEFNERWFDEKQILLRTALENVPNVRSIKIIYENPFQNDILRDLWERHGHALVSIDPSKPSQIHNILQTTSEVGLSIQHFSHRCLPLEILSSTNSLASISNQLTNLHSLRLNLQELPSETELPLLKDFLTTTPNLRDLTISFAGTLLHAPLTFLPHLPHLHSLSLSSIHLSPSYLTPFLTTHALLKNLRIHNASLESIPPTYQTWHSFLSSLKPHLRGLEKFELAGYLRQPFGAGLWNFWPIYEDDWREARMLDTDIGGGWRKDVEDFCLRGDAWPRVEDNCGDDIFFGH